MATYYVSSAGNDSNNGTSTATPWLTSTKVNATIGSGDTVYFNGGDTFSGSTITVTFPAAFDSYGTGKATIACGTTFGIKATNTGSVTVSNLIFTGSTITYTGVFPDQVATCLNETKAVWFDCNTVATAYPGCVVSACEISGFWDPLAFWSTNTSCTLAYTGARVVNNYIHDCLKSGIFFYTEPVSQGTPSGERVHTSPVITGNTIYRIPGSDRGMCMWILNCLEPLIEGNKCTYNGWCSTTFPVVILISACSDALVRYNEVGYFYTHGGDGEGIDPDVFATGTIVEHNYIHDGQTWGLFNFQSHGTVFRYNIVERCGGAFRGSGGDCVVYQNTFYSTGSLATVSSSVCVLGLYNNTISAAVGVRHIDWDGDAVEHPRQFIGNAYETVSGSNLIVRVDTGTPASYTTLTALRAAGYEKNGGTDYGSNGALHFSDAGNGVAQLFAYPVAHLPNYDIAAGSSAITAGIPLADLSITAPTFDWHNNSVVVSAPDSGAVSFGSHYPTNAGRPNPGRRFFFV